MNVSPFGVTRSEIDPRENNRYYSRSCCIALEYLITFFPFGGKRFYTRISRIAVEYLITFFPFGEKRFYTRISRIAV